MAAELKIEIEISATFTFSKCPGSSHYRLTYSWFVKKKKPQSYEAEFKKDIQGEIFKSKISLLRGGVRKMRMI